MATNDSLKRISIDQLTPGMFIVDMDVPWYQTPFLSHKRLIEDVETVRTLKQCGVRTVTIDCSRGHDVQASGTHEETKAQAPAEPTRTTTAEAPAGPASPAPLHAGSAQVLYTEAQEAVERIFTELEQGTPPSPAAAKAVVSGVLRQILDDRTSLLAHVAAQKIRQFDRSLAAHALDTCILSLIVAVDSGFDDAMQAALGTGALLHDVGYVRLPRNLVRRRDTCDEQELLVLQRHPELGAALLRETPGFGDDVIRAAAEHHERADGSGFPAGLKNDDIGALAKIVGLVDWYESLINRRGGRPAMLAHEAVRRLFLAGEGALFEPSQVERVIRSLGVYPVGSLVRLNTGERAVVVGVNIGQRLKPLVTIISGPQDTVLANPLAVDLAAQPKDRPLRTVLHVLDPAREHVEIALYLDGTSPQAA